MATTLSIRLAEPDRAVLEAAAKQHGTGLSTYLRELAETEARRLRRAAIRAEGETVVAALRSHLGARDELEAYGTPHSELP